MSTYPTQARTAPHTPGALAVERDPLVIPQGADWSVGWVYAVGDPPDLPAAWPTGWSARMEIREDHRGGLRARLHSTATADGTLTLGTYTASGVTGVTDGTTLAVITAHLDAATSSDWTWTERPYPWDLELIAPDGAVTRLVEGLAILSAEVTTGA